MSLSGESYSLKPIERTTIADQVSGQLLQLIREGRFSPGQRMPSERQLCEDFGVARTTLREAIQQLVSLGVLERQANRLFVVDHIGVIDVPDEKTKKLKDLVETRRFIEISVTELAVCRATDQQRKELLELADSFHSEMNPEEFRSLNHRFHMKIGECCSNPLLEELYGRGSVFAKDVLEVWTKHRRFGKRTVRHRHVSNRGERATSKLVIALVP